jgi:hypothetical protein
MLTLLERPVTRDVERDPRLDRGALEALRRRGFSDADIEKALASLRSPVLNEVRRPR